jgi:hypothetical protein
MRLSLINGTLLVMRGKIRGWWPLAVVAPFLVAAVWLLYAVWRSPHRSDLATFGAFALPVVTLIVSWIVWAWRTKSARPVIAGQDLDHVMDLLAVAVKMQWEQEAAERQLLATPIPVSWGKPSLPLVGPVAAAANSHRFDPLPGLPSASKKQLAAGQINDLHSVYGGLRSGRLVIAGTPGSGKSGAAVLLLLAALRHREGGRTQDRVKIPVPVMFTVQNWDPRRQSLTKWLIGRLQEAYPLLAGRTGAANAGGLINAGKLTVILDGLDEIAEELRPIALQALNQANFRVVVLSRTAEMAAAASQGGILENAAAIELKPIDATTVADYLTRIQLDPPPIGWRNLIDLIRTPKSPIAQALGNPLSLTLVRDTYRTGDDIQELLDLCNSVHGQITGERLSEKVTDHLLDRVLPVAYRCPPGEKISSYELQVAQLTLCKIATRMTQDGTHDLGWWRLSDWVPGKPRIAWSVLTAGLITGITGGLIAGLTGGLTAGLGVGSIIGISCGLIFGFTASGMIQDDDLGDIPNKIGRFQLRQAFSRDNSMTSLADALIFGLLIGLGFGIKIGLKSGLESGLVAGFAAWLAGGLATGLVVALVVGFRSAIRDLDSTSTSGPLDSWHSDYIFGLMEGITAYLGFGLVFGLGGWLVLRPTVGIFLGLVGGLLTGLGVGPVSSRTCVTSLAFVQLARKWKSPVRLMRFLDDAHKRGILRTVGPVYQFRHARLQDRLTKLESP